MCENAAECVTVRLRARPGRTVRTQRVLKARVEPVYHPVNTPAAARWSRSGVMSADFQLVPVVAIDRLRTIDATGFKTTEAGDDRLDREFRRRLIRGHVELKDRRIVFTVA